MSSINQSNQPETASNEIEHPIRLEQVDKHFERIVALEGVSFEIKDNEILALVGDNGAGKSTLMNVICGVHKPTNGNLYVGGNSVDFDNPEDARAHGIETVFQDLALMDDLDVATNIYMDQFPTRGMGPLQVIDWEETYRQAEEILTGALDRGDIDPHTEVEYLSGGQRQLVAIARALAFDPKVVLLDEPTSALSVEATELVHETVRSLKEEGITVVIVSHSLEEIFGLADRIAVLYQGSLVDVVNTENSTQNMLKHMMAKGEKP